MKKKLWIAGILCLLMLMFSANVFAAGTDAKAQDGTQPLTEEQKGRLFTGKIETAATEIAISNAADLKAFRDRVNNGETALEAYLTADIDLGDQKWTPIGTSAKPYSGTFDGNGYAIDGLNVSSPGAASTGLFAFTDGAYIAGLGVFGSVSGGNVSGGIVGLAADTYIIDCYSYCEVSGIDACGGIAGYILGDDSISAGCFNVGDISGSATDGSFVGGIAGLSDGYVTIHDCYNWGDITSPDGAGGGIAGAAGGLSFIANTYNMGVPNDVDDFGEIAGFANGDGAIVNSYYLDNGYDGIGTDSSSYPHIIYYFEEYYDMMAPEFVDDLNGSAGDAFVFDTYYINSGLPVLSWEEPYSYFDDVSLGSWYLGPVNWAVANDVTTGTSDTQFSPKSVCTRAQTVTFLWRAAGSPQPKSSANPFTDIKSGSYYYNAVLWAVENGITEGTSAKTFSPSQAVSRAQVVTFLWRAAGAPSISVANPFSDIKSDAYYGQAVLWAVGNDITNGTSPTTFAPGLGCTRAEIVTFLYRYFVL